MMTRWRCTLMLLMLQTFELMRLIAPVAAATTAKTTSGVFCDDQIGQYTSMSGKFSLQNTEFPIMSVEVSGLTDAIESFSPQLHPCYSLSDANNYKNQVFDIFTMGNFSTQICRRQCAHFLSAFKTDCGDRRPAPTWLTGRTTGTVRKINCSNWDVPLTKKGVEDGISFTYNYATFDSRSGKVLSPPLGLDNESLSYLNSMFIKGLYIKSIIDKKTGNAAIDGVEEEMEKLVERHPEIVHIAFGDPTSELILKPTRRFFEILTKIETLKSLSLARIAIDDKMEMPEKLVSNLKSISFLKVELEKLPKWLENSRIEFIEILESLNPKTDIIALDSLPNLEHFILKESNLTTIPSPFLKTSNNLISLTIQCNRITTIEAGAFDHLTNLKFLNLAGNRITNLPDRIFEHLNNLLVFDIKAVLTSNTIEAFNEKNVMCQNGLKISKSFILDEIPALPNPEKIVALEVNGQTNFLRNETSKLASFKNVEILNIGNLNLSSIRNLSIATLCRLEDLNLVGNPLNDEDFLPDDVFINVNLRRLRIGTKSKLKKVSETIVAYMRTASQIMYSIPSNLLTMKFYRDNSGCDADLVSKATVFGYKLLNESCANYVEASLEKIQKMEILRMETTCA